VYEPEVNNSINSEKRRSAKLKAPSGREPRADDVGAVLLPAPLS
jgi:hypothetical protein